MPAPRSPEVVAGLSPPGLRGHMRTSLAERPCHGNLASSAGRVAPNPDPSNRPRDPGAGACAAPERDARDGPDRVAEPPDNRATTSGQGGTEHGSVLLDPMSVGPTLAHDQPRGNGHRIPSSLAGDLRRETTLAVESPEQFVHVNEVRLELDDEECAPAGMPRQDVDHASLTVDRERHLRRKDPVRELGLEPPGDRLVERRMRPVEETVEIAAAPARDDSNLDIQRAGDRSDHVDR